MQNSWAGKPRHGPTDTNKWVNGSYSTIKTLILGVKWKTFGSWLKKKLINLLIPRPIPLPRAIAVGIMTSLGCAFLHSTCQEIKGLWVQVHISNHTDLKFKKTIPICFINIEDISYACAGEGMKLISTHKSPRSKLWARYPRTIWTPRHQSSTQNHSITAENLKNTSYY